MLGEHYGSLLDPSGALVDLEKELQSTCMGTKLYQFSLTWNLSITSKSMENQKKLQLQKFSKLHIPSPQIFWEFFSPLNYFPRAQFNYSSYFWVGKQLQHGQPVSGAEANIRPTCRRCPPTWPPPITVSVSARGLKPPETTRRLPHPRLIAIFTDKLAMPSLSTAMAAAAAHCLRSSLCIGHCCAPSSRAKSSLPSLPVRAPCRYTSVFSWASRLTLFFSMRRTRRGTTVPIVKPLCHLLLPL
jgi:hypothetical protein